MGVCLIVLSGVPCRALLFWIPHGEGRVVGAWVNVGASATRPKISNVEASRKYGHNGSGTEDKDAR